jgi:hypothetical protein
MKFNVLIRIKIYFSHFINEDLGDLKRCCDVFKFNYTPVSIITMAAAASIFNPQHNINSMWWSISSLHCNQLSTLLSPRNLFFGKIPNSDFTLHIIFCVYLFIRCWKPENQHDFRLNKKGIILIRVRRILSWKHIFMWMFVHVHKYYFGQNPIFGQLNPFSPAKASNSLKASFVRFCVAFGLLFINSKQHSHIFSCFLRYISREKES